MSDSGLDGRVRGRVHLDSIYVGTRERSITLPMATARSTFGQGAQVFAAAYAAAPIGGCCTDPATRKPIFASVGPRANVVPLTVQ